MAPKLISSVLETFLSSRIFGQFTWLFPLDSWRVSNLTMKQEPFALAFQTCSWANIPEYVAPTNMMAQGEHLKLFLIPLLSISQPVHRQLFLQNPSWIPSCFSISTYLVLSILTLPLAWSNTIASTPPTRVCSYRAIFKVSTRLYHSFTVSNHPCFPCELRRKSDPSTRALTLWPHAVNTFF